MVRHLDELRCVELNGRKASVSLESDFWECLEQIALRSGITLARLVESIGGDAVKDDLAALLRVFVLAYYQEHGDLQLPGAGESNIIEGVPPNLSDKRRYH